MVLYYTWLLELSIVSWLWLTFILSISAKVWDEAFLLTLSLLMDGFFSSLFLGPDLSESLSTSVLMQNLVYSLLVG